MNATLIIIQRGQKTPHRLETCSTITQKRGVRFRLRFAGKWETPASFYTQKEIPAKCLGLPAENRYGFARKISFRQISPPLSVIERRFKVSKKGHPEGVP
jgi:hypothetical protein